MEESGAIVVRKFRCQACTLSEASVRDRGLYNIVISIPSSPCKVGNYDCHASVGLRLNLTEWSNNDTSRRRGLAHNWDLR